MIKRIQSQVEMKPFKQYKKGFVPHNYILVYDRKTDILRLVVYNDIKGKYIIKNSIEELYENHSRYFEVRLGNKINDFKELISGNRYLALYKPTFDIQTVVYDGSGFTSILSLKDNPSNLKDFSTDVHYYSLDYYEIYRIPDSLVNRFTVDRI